MCFQQIAQHLEGALIEVQYAAADVSRLLTTVPPTRRGARDAEVLFTLVAITHLLRDALNLSHSAARP